jgi:hypothetical protein
VVLCPAFVPPSLHLFIPIEKFAMSIVEESAGATDPGEKNVVRKVTVEVEAQEERPMTKAAEKTVRGWIIALGSFLILIPSYGTLSGSIIYKITGPS